MLPELLAQDAMILRAPQGMYPQEKEAIQLLPAGVPVDPWEMWMSGRPSSVIIGSSGKHKVRVGYVRVVFDVKIQADDLLHIEIDGQEYPIAIVQLPPSSIVANVGVAELIGVDLRSAEQDRSMNGTVTFDITRVKRLMDRVISAPA